MWNEETTKQTIMKTFEDYLQKAQKEAKSSSEWSKMSEEHKTAIVGMVASGLAYHDQAKKIEELEKKLKKLDEHACIGIHELERKVEGLITLNHDNLMRKLELEEQLAKIRRI